MNNPEIKIAMHPLPDDLGWFGWCPFCSNMLIMLENDCTGTIVHDGDLCNRYEHSEFFPTEHRETVLLIECYQ